MFDHPGRMPVLTALRAADHVRPAPGTPATMRWLFRRVFLVNVAVLLGASALLILSPVTVSAPIVATELAVLAVGLLTALVLNAVLLRASLRPLDGLTALMERVDLLRPGERLAATGTGDVAHLIRAFNGMLDRLEAERGAQRGPRAGRAGGRAAADRPRAARRDRPEPDRGAAGAQAGRRPRTRASCATSSARSPRRSARAWTRCGRSPAGCAPECSTTSAWSARSTRWPPTSRRQRGAGDRRGGRRPARAGHATPSWSSTASRRRA